MKNKKLIAIFSPALKKNSFVSGIAVYNHRLIKELSRYYDFHIINNNKYDSRYRSEKYWWEFVVLVRKVMLVSISTFASTDQLQLHFSLAILIVSLYIFFSISIFVS